MKESPLTLAASLIGAIVMLMTANYRTAMLSTVGLTQRYDLNYK